MIENQKLSNNDFLYSLNNNFLLSEAGICVYNADRYYYERIVYDYELVFVTEGQFFARENDKVITLEKNQGYIFFPREHRQKGPFPISKGTTYFWMHFNFLESPNQCVNSTGNNEYFEIPRFATPKDANRLITLLKWYIQDYVDKTLNISYHNNLFALILKEFSRIKPDIVKKTINPNVATAYSFIMKNFSTDITIPQIAKYVGCNPDYLTKQFKETFGKTIIRFINDIRIEYAKRLLTTTNTPIKMIASESGYHSDIHFRQTFKKHAGCTPSAYRCSRVEMRINPS